MGSVFEMGGVNPSMSYGITLVDVHLNWLSWFHFFVVRGPLVILTDCMIFLSSF